MSRSTRRRYIDWARALAVFVMIEAHTIDVWTWTGERKTLAFRHATIVGGFAAPLFLWLAGLSLVLSAASVARRRGDRASAVDVICRRGLEIFLLAFLFRLQALILTPGGALVTLFRVDILNIMGPAMVVAGVVWGLARTTTRLVVAYAAIATAFAMLTPIVRATALVDRLPLWFQWYLRPTGDLTIFTAFPWAGFVFAGAAVGVLIAAVPPAAEPRPSTGSARAGFAEGRLQVWLGVAGAALVAAGFYAATRPTLYARTSFWTSSPTWFAIRVGILMIALTALYALAQLAEHRGVELRRVERFGRSSLFVYWIHVELVYGYASWPLRGRLPLWGSLVACALFSVLMYGAIVLRDRIVETWQARRPPGGPAWYVTSARDG